MFSFIVPGFIAWVTIIAAFLFLVSFLTRNNKSLSDVFFALSLVTIAFCTIIGIVSNHHKIHRVYYPVEIVRSQTAIMLRDTDDKFVRTIEMKFKDEPDSLLCIKHRKAYSPLGVNTIDEKTVVFCDVFGGE